MEGEIVEEETQARPDPKLLPRLSADQHSNPPPLLKEEVEMHVRHTKLLKAVAGVRTKGKQITKMWKGRSRKFQAREMQQKVAWHSEGKKESRARHKAAIAYYTKKWRAWEHQVQQKKKLNKKGAPLEETRAQTLYNKALGKGKELVTKNKHPSFLLQLSKPTKQHGKQATHIFNKAQGSGAGIHATPGTPLGRIYKANRKTHTIPLLVPKRRVKAANKRHGCHPIVLFDEAVRDLVTREKHSKRTARRWWAKALASKRHADHLGKLICQLTGALKCAKQMAQRGEERGLHAGLHAGLNANRPAHASCENQKHLEAYREWVKYWSELSAHEEATAYRLRMKAKFSYQQVCEITGDKRPYAVAAAEFLRTSE